MKHPPLIASLFLLGAFASAIAQKPVYRFLLVAGANDGGAGRPVLRYAESDAHAFASVLGEMGGVSAEQKVVLREPSLASMRQGFQSLEQKLRDKRYAGGHREVVVYYSGHADEQGLRLGRELLQWPELRRRVDALGAEVKIAVVDACGSGAITRIKGGVARPAFLSDASTDMKGYAFLTSSSADESSQESDRLRGSFFTHALVSGLRGAADMSGDGKVTLGEAYQFAFNETLQKTQSTSGGAQHPSRDMNLAGTGDVVMTDVRQTSAGLTLDASLEGRVFIRDSKGNLVAELYKHAGRALELGLPADTYQVQLEKQQSWKAENLRLPVGKRLTLNQQSFHLVKREKATARGNAEGPSVLDSLEETPYEVEFGFFYGHSDDPGHGMLLSALATDAKKEWLGTQISPLGNLARRDVSGAQVALGANLSLGDMEGLQVSSSFNMVSSMHGLQLTSGVNLCDTLQGAQFSSAVNIAYGQLYGWQGGVVNIAAADGKGVQGGVVNVVKELDGVQGGVLNYAGRLSHVQGGVLNVAGRGGSLQGGVLNIADSAGWQGGVYNIADSIGERQIGLVNISRYSAKSPIGLFNLVGNGIFDVQLSLDETGAQSLTLHTGTPWLYTLFEHNRDWRGSTWPQSWGIGLGTRFGATGSFFQLDYAFLNVYSKRPDHIQIGSANVDEESGYWHKIRLGAAYKLFKGVALSGGLSLNAHTEGYSEGLSLEPRGEYHWHWTQGSHTARIWPGAYAGLVLGKF